MKRMEERRNDLRSYLVVKKSSKDDLLEELFYRISFQKTKANENDLAKENGSANVSFPLPSCGSQEIDSTNCAGRISRAVLQRKNVPVFQTHCHQEQRLIHCY